ncbi:hypothetical protein ACFLVZ_01135 [Chloroflexota bacterium]
MKIASIIVLIGLIVIPIILSFSIRFFRVITKGFDVDAGTSSTASPSPEKLKMRRRMVFIAGSFYGVLLFAAVFWVLIQAIAPSLGREVKETIFAVINMVVLVIWGVLGYVLWNRYLLKVNPFTREGSEGVPSLEWWNKYADISVKYFPLFLILFVGSYMLVFALLCLIFYIFA